MLSARKQNDRSPRLLATWLPCTAKGPIRIPDASMGTLAHARRGFTMDKLRQVEALGTSHVPMDDFTNWRGDGLRRDANGIRQL